MNKVILIGNLGSDPEIITSGCKISLCIEDWNGQKKKIIWIKVLVFGSASTNCLNHLEKGRKIAIEGKFDYTRAGTAVIVTDKVEFLS